MIAFELVKVIAQRWKRLRNVDSEVGISLTLARLEGVDNSIKLELAVDILLLLLWISRSVDLVS